MKLSKNFMEPFKRGLIFSFFLMALISVEGCTKNDSTSTATQAADSNQPAAAATSEGATNVSATNQPNIKVDLTTDEKGLSKTTAVMKTTKGTVKFKFYAKDAPNTVNRFIELANAKFYNGLAFHRVVPRFVVQTGDPKSVNKDDPAVGTGGSGTKQKAEFNARKHVRGTVAMARAADPNSADSQFYLCLDAFPHLDGSYTVFGQVVDSGEKVEEKDVLDRIVQWDKIIDVTFE